MVCDRRTTRDEAYRLSQNVRRRMESIFGWRVPADQVCGVGADRTVWRVGNGGEQPGENVEADRRPVGRGTSLRLVFRS